MKNAQSGAKLVTACAAIIGYLTISGTARGIDDSGEPRGRVLPRANEKTQMLAGFEQADDLARWQAAKCTMKRVRQYATGGEFSLKVDFTGSPEDTWPGIRRSLVVGERDFSKVFAIELDACKPEPPGKPLYVQVIDGNNKQTILTSYIRPGKPQTYRYVLKKNTALDWRNIVAIFLYRSKPRQDYSLYIDSLRLIHGDH